MCHSNGRPTSGKVPIRFGTYNIRNGQNGGLEAALRGMSQANMDLGILQETKVTDGIYTRGSAEYSGIATDAPSRHLGGVAIFYRSAPHFVVEAVEKFGPNVIGFQLATGAWRWYKVEVYLAPEDTTTMERVSKAIRSKQRGAELLVAGDFNVNLAAPEGNRRAEDIATALATEGLEDLVRHFLPRETKWFQYRRTWGVIRKGKGGAVPDGLHPGEGPPAP